MKRVITVFLAQVFICTTIVLSQSFEIVEFPSIDGLTITADLYETKKMDNPIILMFHQSASSRGEFRTVAPKLVKEGFNVLAVDLRWGKKDFWNHIVNKTAERNETPKIMEEEKKGNREKVWPTIFDSYDDMLAAIDWTSANGFTGKKLLLGSSFSSIFIFKAAQDRKIDGILSYSPGEYYDDETTMVQSWVKNIEIPIYIVAGTNEKDFTTDIFNAITSDNKTYFHAKKGRHGASILLADSNNLDSLKSYLEIFKSPKEVSYQTKDNILVYSDLYINTKSSSKNWILLFHQAGANGEAEYAAIIPRLLNNGYNVLVVNQRVGGKRLGGKNKTVDSLKSKKEFRYCDAYPDMEASLKYILENESGIEKIILWGSSYSAALIFKVAANFPDNVKGLLAFSPASGKPMVGCEPEDYLQNISAPVLVLRPPEEMQYGWIQSQTEEFKNAGFETYTARNGVHGSSMLNIFRTRGSIEENWQVVFRFLRSL